MRQKNRDFNTSMDESRRKEREMMVETQIRVRGITDERVLSAMESVPRHFFVPLLYQSEAYADHPIPIGYDQTISQPYIVAVMTALLLLNPSDHVLEIGTGSGYQAAVLAKIVEKVISIERIDMVAEIARSNLEKTGICNVSVLIRDGTRGYPESAPYDAILVTAAAPRIPDHLKDQLAIGGRLVAPVGDRGVQELIRLTRMESGFTTDHHGMVRFVPLIGEYGWKMPV